MTTWSDVARDARRAANELVRDRHRSCCSRAYYAAYAAVAHRLTGLGVAMPRGREGPNHPGQLPGGDAGGKGIRQMIVTHLTDLDAPRRTAGSEIIGSLYTLRLYADYRPSIRVEAADAREAVSMMNRVFDLL